jgi:hypothetical protein
MWERLDLRGANGEIRVKQIGKTDAVRLGRQPKKATVGVECVGSSGLKELEAAFLASIDEALTDPAIHPEHEIQGVRSKSRDLNDLRDPGGIETAQSGFWLDVLKGVH